MNIVRIYIANQEVCCSNQIEINEEVLNTSSVILNKVQLINDRYTFYMPKDYSNCKIYIDNVLKFNGIIKNSGDVILNPAKPKFIDLQVLDYKCLLSEGKNLDFVIVNKTITEAINQVVDYIKDYGFEVGTINITNDTIIGAYSTLDKAPYDMFQYLAEISESIWSTRVIDEDTIAIDFISTDLLTTSKTIEFNESYFIANNIENIQYSFGTRDYRNKQFILSDNVYASIDTTELVLTDGFTKNFLLQNNIAEIKSITIDDTIYSFATNTEKDLGIYADFYYTQGNNYIETNIDVIPSGNEIIVIYTALVDGRQVSQNRDEIERISSQILRNGEITRYENRNDITTQSELLATANSIIKYKGIPEINLTVITRNNDLLNVGQKVVFNIEDLNLIDLKTDYLVKTKKTLITANDTDTFIQYTYELSSNFNAENVINYFDNQRRKRKGNLDKGKYITRNIDITNTATILFDNFELREIEVLGNNTLDANLDFNFKEV